MRLFRLLLASALVLSPLAARADYLFTFSGTETATFTLPASPSVYDVNYLTEFYVNTNSSNPSFSTVQFYNIGDGGAFADVTDGNGFAGAQVYSGSEYDPTFILGTYEFLDYNTGTLPEQLVISSTPEPSSLVLLGTGALGLAGAIRRRFSK